MKNQSGNALFFILIAIGLLGLLTVMMSRSSNNSNETGNFEQNSISVSQILSYTKNMENAVQGLLARGCSENTISFWHDSDGNGTEDASDDYFNAASPPDRSCYIFEPEGAGLSWAEPNEKWLDNDYALTGSNYGSYVLNSKNSIRNLELDSRDELIIFLNWIDRELCESINLNLFSDPTIPLELNSFSYNPSADGVYDTVIANINLSASPTHDGKPTVCMESQANTGYHFYHTLHAR